MLQEDDIAQIKTIFEAFDIGNRDRVKIEELPDVLRLMQYNIGENEAEHL